MEVTRKRCDQKKILSGSVFVTRKEWKMEKENGQTGEKKCDSDTTFCAKGFYFS